MKLWTGMFIINQLWWNIIRNQWTLICSFYEASSVSEAENEGHLRSSGNQDVWDWIDQ